MSAKISELPAGSALAGTEPTVVVQGGVTVQVPASYHTTLARAGFTANGISLISAADYAAMRALLDLEAGTDFNAYTANLAALSAQASTGLMIRTGSGTYTTRTLTAPAAGITVSDGDGIAGNPTLVLANDLAALEALSGTNTIYYRSASDTWTAVTIGGNLTFSGGTLNAVGAGTGTVTHTAGALTLNQLVFGNGTDDIKVGDLTGDVTTSGGTATTLTNYATASEYVVGTSTSKVLNPDKVWDSAAFVALTPGTNVSLDLSTGINFTLAMNGDYTLDNPTNAKEGQTGVIRCTQDGTGTQTLAYGNQYRFAGGTDIVLSTAAGTVDLIFYVVLPGPLIFLSAQKAIAA